MRPALAAALFAAVAGAAAASPPSKKEVLVAISVLEKNITGPEAADAAKTVVIYAQESDDVMVDIGQDQLPWIGERWGLDKSREQANQSLLLAAFVAGNIRSQIKNDKAEDDTYSGWVFAIDAYRRLRAKTAFRSPAIESLKKMEDEGTLLRHARDVQFKDEDSQRPPLAQGSPAWRRLRA
ncbi:MAG TPA: hypothetical protein VKG78_02970 [Opitutaceae bacterium]|nr:hypothetical protein [Opitutaceae bacterium]